MQDRPRIVMRRRPAVTVAICLFNSSRFIDEALESVFAQTFDDYEVVIVDDGSTDGCAELVERRYGDRRLSMIRQEHQGLSRARRMTIAAAAGEFVAFLDSDDLWLPEKLERQMAAARHDPAVALLCSDCACVDERGRPLGLVSEQYALDGIDLTGTQGYVELLRRGCFVWQCTVIARTTALRAVDAYNPAYPYIADYDTWLRMARRYPMQYTREVLAKWRVHPAQLTHRCADVSLSDHRKLLGPLLRTASIPEPIRSSIGTRLVGQHLIACRTLSTQRRFRSAARAAAGVFSYPDRLLDVARVRVARAPLVGPALQRGGRATRRILRTVSRWRPEHSTAAAPAHVWIDGSVLGRSQAGHFSLVSELIRPLVRQRSCAVHVTASAAGQQALRRRLEADSDRVQFHTSGWLTRRQRHANNTEIVIWRGRFRWAESRKVAIVPDLTTRIHPELHTADNIAEFDDYLKYVQRHAEHIVTISENSRKDILERLDVFPDSVSVMPMPVHPAYSTPTFTPAFVAAHGITQPYILCVGCIEPRKNLRRLVRAFELLKEQDAARNHLLVFAGPPGWDGDFARFVVESDAYRRIRLAGFVPVEHLPSLYRFASAVIYPSVYEGFGLPVLEAMSSSAIALASATSSLPEVLGNGITFDPWRTEAIAAAILEALSMSDAEAAQYRRRCRLRAEALLERSACIAPLPGLASASGAVRV